MSELGPLDRQWGEALKRASTSDCITADDLLNLHEQGRKLQNYDRLMDHVVSCQECLAALESLRELDGARKSASGGWLKRLQTSLSPKVTVPLLAGIAVLTLIVIGLRSQSNWGLVVIKTPGIDPIGSQTTDALPKDVRAVLKQVLTTHRIDVPSDIQAYDPNAGVERGPNSSIHLKSPYATYIATTSITFKWAPVPKASSYKVVLLPAGGPAITLSVANDRMFDYAKLVPGERYQWQVLAELGGRSISSAPAAFRVLTDSERAEAIAVAKILNHEGLSAGIALSHLGLLDQADAALAKAELGPNKEAAARLRSQIQAKRIKPSR